jgi:hypothetical protein
MRKFEKCILFCISIKAIKPKTIASNKIQKVKKYERQKEKIN